MYAVAYSLFDNSQCTDQAWGQVQGIVLESKYKYISTWQVQVQVQVQDFDRVLESKYKYF